MTTITRTRTIQALFIQCDGRDCDNELGPSKLHAGLAIMAMADGWQLWPRYSPQPPHRRDYCPRCAADEERQV